MSTKERITSIFLSVLAMENACFCPIYNHEYGSGLFPKSYLTFEDVCETIQQYIDMEADMEYWIFAPVIPLTVVCFVIALIMLIGAIVGSRTIFASGCELGTGILGILMIFYFFVYAIESENPFYEMFDIEHGDVAYGLWVAIALSIISCFVIRGSSKKKTQDISKLNSNYKSRDLSTF